MSSVALNRGPAVPAAARCFLQYVAASPSPFHATASSVSMLEEAGFTKLHEHQSWNDKLYVGGRYYVQRNQSSLVAFVIGKQFTPGQGVHIIGAHTDSPHLRIRPISKRSKEGYLQCSVETYGGGQWHTWFDRDLSLAGRVIVAQDASRFVSRLVHIQRPLLRVPTLAIHLNRSVNEAFTFNHEDQLQPILGLASMLNEPDQSMAAVPGLSAKHHPVLLELLAQELDVPVSAIQDFELSLYDTQPPAVGGVSNEFLFAPRIDNQMSCFCATEALVASVLDLDALNTSQSIRAIALFDHEEVGSVSNQGAESNLLWSMIHRLSHLHVNGVEDSTASSAADLSEQSLARSFLISSDTAHAVHPNYASVHEQNLRPRMNAGPVIKINAKQRYASNAATSFLLRRVAQKAGVPVQEFEVRNDCACGSTIGPMLSKMVRTVDVGNPQLSMHSIREVCGSHDVDYKIRLFVEFFRSFEQVDRELHIDD